MGDCAHYWPYRVSVGLGQAATPHKLVSGVFWRYWTVPKVFGRFELGGGFQRYWKVPEVYLEGLGSGAFERFGRDLQRIIITAAQFFLFCRQTRR